RVLLLNQGKLLFTGPPSGLTERVAGRVYKITGIEGRRRPVLAKILDRPGIVDGVIQGEAIRLVTDAEVSRSALAADLAASAAIVSTPPGLEDAFVDMWGGGRGGRSKLAEATKTHENADPHVIGARGLKKRFGNFTAADDITFDIRRGEIFG